MRNCGPSIVKSYFSKEMGNWDFSLNSSNFQLLIQIFKNSVNQRKHICGSVVFVTSSLALHN